VTNSTSLPTAPGLPSPLSGSFGSSVDGIACLYATYTPTASGIPPMLLGSQMMFARERRRSIWWTLSFLTRPCTRLLLPRKVLAV
jgi:hypothetical protein